MKATDVRERSSEELRGMEQELARQLWQARLDNHTNQLDDTASVRRLRKDIARVKTILRERELLGAEGEVVAHEQRAAKAADEPTAADAAEQE